MTKNHLLHVRCWGGRIPDGGTPRDPSQATAVQAIGICVADDHQIGDEITLRLSGSMELVRARICGPGIAVHRNPHWWDMLSTWLVSDIYAGFRVAAADSRRGAVALAWARTRPQQPRWTRAGVIAAAAAANAATIRTQRLGGEVLW